MAYIDNTETNRELNEAIRGNANTNIAPQSISGQVMPVIDINPKNYRRANICKEGSTTGTSYTIYTTPTDRDFYLTTIQFTYTKNATADLATNDTLGISLKVNGATQYPIYFSTLTLTAQSDSIAITFATPLKIDRGSVIQLVRGAITAGNVVMSGSITGYTVDLN